MWTNAGGVLNETLHGVDNAVTVHENGSYFMGQPTADPGALYYPVALPFRMTPWLLFGVPLAGVAAFRGALREQWRLWLAVALYVAFYMMILTWQGKKFDRYALPVFPALHLLAACGWVWLARVIWHDVPRVAWAGAIVVIVGHGLWYAPHEYAYFNPLLGGGGDHVEHMLIMGGGEGLQGTAAYFADVETCPVVASAYAHLMERYLSCGRALWLGELNAEVIVRADYIVNYISYRQRFPASQAVLQGTDPVHTVEIHGVTYAEIYATDALSAPVAEQAAQHHDTVK
jgi:4-amino-4-deoxy-L-arabinose transferase-like glycosyltransferase